MISGDQREIKPIMVFRLFHKHSEAMWTKTVHYFQWRMIGNWSADATIDANVSRREKTKTKSQIKWINVKMCFGRNFSLIELWIKCVYVYVCKCNVYLSKKSKFFVSKIFWCIVNWIQSSCWKVVNRFFFVYAVVCKAHSLWKWRKMLAFNQLINLWIEHFNVFDSPDFCSFFIKYFYLENQQKSCF